MTAIVPLGWSLANPQLFVSLLHVVIPFHKDEMKLITSRFDLPE
jgi:hypothetical protein